MKKRKSLFGRLTQKVGRTPDKAGRFYCQVVETKAGASLRESTSFVENAFRPIPLRSLPALWDAPFAIPSGRNQRQKISVNLGNLWLI